MSRLYQLQPLGATIVFTTMSIAKVSMSGVCFAWVSLDQEDSWICPMYLFLIQCSCLYIEGVFVSFLVLRGEVCFWELGGKHLSCTTLYVNHVFFFTICLIFSCHIDYRSGVRQLYAFQFLFPVCDLCCLFFKLAGGAKVIFLDLGCYLLLPACTACLCFSTFDQCPADR